MAQVGAYNFRVLVDGQVRDQACYGRDLTLDAGVSLAATGGLVCATGGARSAALGAGDYANSAVFSFIADVTPLDATPGVRYVVAHVRSDGTLAKAMLLSDADGYFAVEIDGAHYSSGVNVLDGKHALCVVYDFDGNLTFYVDGVQVHQTIRSNVNYATGTHFSVGRGATAATGVARAVVGNVRLFNDPVYGEPEVRRFMSSPVEDMLTAAYNFDVNAGTVVVDQSIYGNDLTLTPNGVWTPGKNGSALGPAANTGAAAIGTGLTLGDYDRLNVSCWVRVDFAGSAEPFLSLEAADGSPRFRLYRGGANGLLMKSWRTDDGTADQYQFGNDGVFVTGGPYVHVAVDINPTGWNMVVNGEPWAGGTNGRPPTNDPIVTGLSTLRVGGDAVSGPASIDDLRIIRNYLNPDAIRRLMAEPVTQVPRGTLNLLRVDGVQPNAIRVGDASGDVLLYVDGIQVYGDVPSEPEPLPVGLMAQWTFDDPANLGAERVAGRTLTLEGAVPVAARGGYALAASGASARGVADDGFLSRGGFTVCAWFLPTSVTSTSQRVAFLAGSTAVAELYYWYRNVGGTPYDVRRAAVVIGGASRNALSSVRDLSGGANRRWRMLAAVYDGATIALYEDGVLVTSTAASGLVDDPDTFEAYAVGDGAIDDVEVWDYPLSADEIADRHTATKRT